MIGGGIEAKRIFAADVSTLDEAGKKMRHFDRETYFYRNAGYTVQFRPRVGERYVLVTAAPDLVGNSYDSIETGVAADAAYTAVGTIAMYTGVDRTQTRVFSYEGQVNTIVALPKAAIEKMGSN